ncbi:MAG: hypothetical protein ABI604_20940 [Nitrospirota bacterium]
MQSRYWEAQMIGWRILWQGTGTVVAALFTMNLLLLALLPELPRATPSLWTWAIPLLAVFIMALLTKPFHGILLCIVRESDTGNS